MPDPRLAKKAVNALSSAVDASATYLSLAQPTGGLPSPTGPHLYPAATDVLIGSEIISYGALNASGLSSVTRGAYKTVASSHPAGTTLFLLTQVYGGFLPDPKTDMIDEIAGNIAYAYNEAGMSMIYFDGLEGHSPTGPLATAQMHQGFYNHLKREALVESSDSAPGFLWHLNTRQGQTDWAATDRRAFLDYTKGPMMKNTKCGSLDVPDIGWWGYLLYAPGAYYATTPDECEYMASRAVGWSASPNFETQVTAFEGNGRTDDCLARIKSWLALEERVPAGVRAALTATGVDFALEASSGASAQFYVRPGKAHTAVIADPRDTTSLNFELSHVYGAGGRLGVRVRALEAVAPPGNATDLLQLAGGTARNAACLAPALNYTIVSDAPAGGPETAALRLQMTAGSLQTTQCVRSQFAAPLDLSTHRVLEFSIHGDGSGGVLDIQLQDATAGVREFFLVLNFTGWKTIRAATPATRELYTHAGGPIPWASHPGGNDNRAMRSFSWSKILAVNFQMTNTMSTTVFVGKLDALELEPGSTGAGGTLSVGGTSLGLPLLHGTGSAADYVECTDVKNASSCVAYNATNWPLKTSVWGAATQPIAAAAEEAGNDGIAVEFKPAAGSSARVEVSVFEWEGDQGRLGPF